MSGRKRYKKKCKKYRALCHDIFDSKWKNGEAPKEKRKALYNWLARELGIRPNSCHFARFKLNRLKEAYRILSEAQFSDIDYPPTEEGKPDDNCQKWRGQTHE